MSTQPDPPDFEEFRAVVEAEARSHWVGVYEVWWDANGRYPERPLSDRLAIAERLVAGLWSAHPGFRIAWSGWPATVLTPVDDADPLVLLREWTTWVIDERVIWFTIDD